MKLDEVREEIHEQLGLDNVPLTFVILRSVGRNFTQVRNGVFLPHRPLITLRRSENIYCARNVDGRIAFE